MKPISEIQALRYLAAELELRENLQKIQASHAYYVVKPGGRAVHCFFDAQLLADQAERIQEARKQLHAIQAPLAALHGLK